MKIDAADVVNGDASGCSICQIYTESIVDLLLLLY